MSSAARKWTVDAGDLGGDEDRSRQPAGQEGGPTVSTLAWYSHLGSELGLVPRSISQQSQHNRQGANRKDREHR